MIAYDNPKHSSQVPYMNCIIEKQARIIKHYENYKCWRGIRYYDEHETRAKNSFNAIVYKQPPLLVNISS